MYDRAPHRFGIGDLERITRALATDTEGTGDPVRWLRDLIERFNLAVLHSVLGRFGIGGATETLYYQVAFLIDALLGLHPAEPARIDQIIGIVEKVLEETEFLHPFKYLP